jgi:hypothetical protein
MDTMKAFMMGEIHRNDPQRVFDWELAAHLIAGRQPKKVRAGLSGDWEYTGGPIWRDGKPVPKEETYVFLASTWATPEIEIDGETLPCFRLASDSPGWAADTYWPPEALAILGIKSIPESVYEGEVLIEVKERLLLTDGGKDEER